MVERRSDTTKLPDGEQHREGVWAILADYGDDRLGAILFVHLKSEASRHGVKISIGPTLTATLHCITVDVSRVGDAEEGI